MKQFNVDYIKLCSETLPIQKGNILEVGSRRADGQERYKDIRDFFPEAEYIGLDMQEGNKVDQVGDVHNLLFADNYFDTIICMETFEHVARPWIAIDELYRVLKPEGFLIMTVPFDCPIHEHPHDYYRYTPDGLRVLLRQFILPQIDSFGLEDNPHTITALATKEPRFIRMRYRGEVIDKLQKKYRKENPYSIETFIKSCVPPVLRNLIGWPKEGL